MAWANKYRFRFDSVHGVEYNIYIQKDGYTGDVIQRKLGRAPVLKKKQNGPICGTSLELFAECAVDGEFAELYTSDPKEYRVVVYRDSVVIWTGFVSTELYSEPSIAPPYDVQIVATDGLGELKLNTYQAQGEVSLKALLIYLLGFTGSNRGFYFATNIKHTGGGRANMLDWTINLDFLDWKSCYDVLTQLLDSLHATITTYSDRWLIARETDIASLLSSAGSLSIITCTASGTVSTASLAGIRKSVGKMGVADMFPNGNLSTAIEPARNSVVVKAPWHFVNAFEGSDLKTAAATSLWGHDNLEVRQSIFDPWLPATHAVAGSGYYVGDTLTGTSPGYISRQFSVTNINGVSFDISVNVVAKVVNPTNLYLLLGSRLMVYLKYTDTTGTLYWTQQKGWHEDELEVSYEDIGAAASEQKSQRQFSVPPCTLRTTSSGSLVLYISGFNFCAEYANMQIRRPESGYQDTIYIDNGARGADSEVEIVGGRVLSDNIPDPSFFQGIWKYNGSLLYSFADSYHSGVDFMSLQALDRAVSVALARTKTEGVVDVPSGVSRIPLVIRQGSQNSWVNTWEWDMVKADVKISAMSIPNANITVEDEVVEPMTGSSGSSSSGGGSSYSGGGSSTGGGGTSLLRVWQSLTNNGELEEYGPETKIDAAHLPDLNYFEEDGNGNIKLKDQYSGLWASGFITAGGVGTGGGGGGVDVLDVWKSLTNNPSLSGYDDNTQIAVAHIPDLSWSKITSGKPTTISGYGITDAYTKSETDSAISTAIEALPNPMLFKGSLGTGGTITSLPAASSSNEGWTYKVITAGTYAGQAAKIGDMFISNGTAWIYVPSGDEPSGTVTSVGLSVPTGLSVSGSPITTSGTLAITFASGYSIPTTAKQTAWDAKYDKPSGGIPKSDLASAVQTSLGKADTAVQPSALSLYLPLTGGTMEGEIDFIDGGSITLQGDNILSVDSNNNIEIGASILGGDVRIAGGGVLYYNTYDVWHAGNDGSGSGLDADLLDGQHGSYYATASSVTTLQGYFTNGVANSAARLSGNTAYTAFGNTFFQNGVPVSIAAGSNITGTGDVVPNDNNEQLLGYSNKKWLQVYAGTLYTSALSGHDGGIIYVNSSLESPEDFWFIDADGSAMFSGGLTIGTSNAAQAAELVWDDMNNAWHLKGNFYADGFITAGGIGTGGSGGGGIDISDVWQSLTNAPDPVSPTQTTKISLDHIPVSLSGTTITFNDGIHTTQSINVATATDLSNYVNTLTSDSSTGNVVTAISKSGNTLTVTKGITALTSHQTVTLASGTNNGTLKLTTAAGTTDNIAVKGLGSLAYKSSLVASDIPDISGSYVRRYEYTLSAESAVNITFGGVYSAIVTGQFQGNLQDLNLICSGYGNTYVRNKVTQVNTSVRSLHWRYHEGRGVQIINTGNSAATIIVMCSSPTGADPTFAAATYDTTSDYKDAPLALASSLNSYLPLSGGTMTGAITFLAGNSKTVGLQLTVAGGSVTNNMDIGWDWATGAGSGIALRSSTATGGAGAGGFDIYARSSTATANTKHLRGTAAGALSWEGSFTATSIIKSGGTSAQFLKADGSVDSNTYLTTSSAADTYVKLNPGTVEQTITSQIASLSKGVVNFWRKSGDHYTFIGFSNGTTETYLGGIGFKSQSDHNLYRKDGSNYYKIYDENNHTLANHVGSSAIGASNKPIYYTGSALAAVSSVGEAFLSWGGKNFSGSYGPVDAAMVGNLGACRTMFAKAAGVVIEYSVDSGATWSDYGATDAQKVGLFSDASTGFVIGKNTTSGAGGATKMVRVTLNTSAAGVYTNLIKFVLFVGTNGSTGCYCTIRARLQSNYEGGVDTWATFADQIPISGWSGYNVINTSALTTYGNTKTSQYGQVQFIFGCTSEGSGSSTGLCVYKIFCFGGAGWTTPSNMAKNGHIYSWDSNQNTIFPAGVIPNVTDSTLGSDAKRWKLYSTTVHASSSITSNGDAYLAYTSANGGFRLTTGNGISYIQIKPASGNSGKLTLSGYNGETGDTLNLKYSALTTLGTFKLTGSTKKIWFGDTYYIELDSNNYLHSNAPFWSDGFITAGGLGTGGGGITIDDALSPTSENPVQNKVIYATIGDVESLLAAI